MTRTTLVLLCIAAAGCGNSSDSTDRPPPRDAGHYPDGAAIDAGPDPIDFGPNHDSGGPVDSGALADGCIPTFEICGDHHDQNCDGHDEPCGDNDHDGQDACCPNPGTATCPYNPVCDCDDSSAAIRAPSGGLPGAPEICDGLDNDCNGRVDESAACCAGCAAMAPDFTRADICSTDGTCVCSTDGAGNAPCATGQTCCVHGCVDTMTDFNNCGHCQSMCTAQSDHCGGGMCMCGPGPGCAAGVMCPGSGGC